MRKAPVQLISMESLEIEVDFPVALGEFVRSQDGWLGIAESHTGKIVRVTPLDPPERVKVGDVLEFTGETLDSRLGCVRPGTVVDPLGRFIMNVAFEEGETQAQKSADAASRGSLRGLKNLGTFMSLREGEGVAIVGTPPGGLPALFSQFALSTTADYLFIYCQGGYRELYRYARAVTRARRAGETIILWTPPWALPAMKNLASRSLERIVSSGRRKGRGLVLIDDLHYWLESVREWGESSNEIFLPDGYPYTARRQMAEFLDLKSPPDGKGNSLSIVVGWRYEADDATTDQAYLARLSHFMRTGIVLEERAEFLRPSDASWGELSHVALAWHELRRTCENCDEETYPALRELTEIFSSLFVEYSPLDLLSEPEERVPFSSEDETSLLKVAQHVRSDDLAEIRRLRRRLLEMRENQNPDDPFSTTVSEGKKLFLAWIAQVAKDEEVLE